MSERAAKIGIALSVLLTTGCAGMQTNPVLEQARADVTSALSDPTVVERATPESDSAREHLETAESVWEDKGESAAARVNHEAFMASRYAELARTKAETEAFERQIENAEVERARILARAESARADELERRLEALQAERTNRGIVLTLGDVLFETDQAELKRGAELTINRLAGFMAEYEERSILIEGHTDSRGSDAYNRMLSERRARAVRDALVARGVDPDRVHVRGMGEQAPVASNDTAAGRQQNRRVEVVVSDADGNIPGLVASSRG